MGVYSDFAQTQISFNPNPLGPLQVVIYVMQRKDSIGRECGAVGASKFTGNPFQPVCV